MTLKFVICTNSAFSIVENKHLMELVTYVSSGQAHLPTTKTLMTDLDAKYIQIKSKLIHLIHKTKYVCLTADGWTNKSRSFMGITIHMLDENLVRHSFLLAFRRMIGRHTFETIKDMLLLVINQFEITTTKITHIVTDGASNFEKAFKIFGQNNLLDLTVETQSETNRDGNVNYQRDDSDENDVEEDSVDIDKLLASEDGGMYIPPETEIIQIGDCIESNDDIEDIDIEDRLPDQLKCYSHGLNRTGVDFENTLYKNEKRTYDVLNGAFTKLKNFWNLNSRSSVAHEIIVRICGRSFPYPTDTRWNSKPDSVEVAEKHKLKINDAIDQINIEAKKNAPHDKRKKLEKLSTLEWKVLKDYTTTLRPLAMGLDVLQGDHKTCMGYILPVLYGIKAKIEKNIENSLYTTEQGGKFYDVLMDCFNKRFSGVMRISEENKNLILAAAIHSNFKLSWLQDEPSREFVQGMLINACVDVASTLKQNEPVNECNQGERSDKTSSNENSFFIHLRTKENLRRTSSEDSTTLDVFKYITQPLADPTVHEFCGSPVLQEIFRRYNTTLSSSGPVERIFSKALAVLTNRRTRITDGNFEKSLFVYQNKSLSN